MAHTREFDCKVCGAHLDSREELDRHNRADHGSMQANPPRSGSESPRRSSPSNEGGEKRS